MMIADGKVYEEFRRPRMFWVMLIMLAGCIGAFAAGGVAQFKNGFQASTDGVVFVIGCVVVPIPLMYLVWASRSYSVVFDGKDLWFGFGSWGVLLKSEEIATAQKVDIKWREWGGIGWWLGGIKHSGYIVGNGSGIKITIVHKDGRTPIPAAYTFNCLEPVQLLKLLQEANVKALQASFRGGGAGPGGARGRRAGRGAGGKAGRDRAERGPGLTRR
ncbi:Uncharacterized protein SCF082_LOCUS31851 [Durusdinium trenchii]|uniref:Bacterial Pleckstrin homology domain-containing protein n=1 Tax=Durusdinium trenchii TaxID=1381693 RepID=A0ABP0NA71_9DINO